MIWMLLACTDETTTTDGPTWHQNVAPVVAANCVSCHSPTGLNPDVDFTSYATAGLWASTMAADVQSGKMPPFLGRETSECAPIHDWTNDRRLSDEDIQLITDWADAGAPEGDPDTAAALPTPPSEDLEGAGTPLEPNEPYTTDVARGADEFICVVFDPKLTSDGYLTGMQALPGDRRVVHHVTVYLDPDNETAGKLTDPDIRHGDGWYECDGGPGVSGSTFLLGYVPGAGPMRVPEGAGFTVPAGSRIVAQMHYHPSRTEPIADATRLAPRWASSRPAQPAFLKLIGNFQKQNADGTGLQPDAADRGSVEFRIPAGDANHSETMTWEVPDLGADGAVFMTGNHMHYVGVGMRTEVVHKDGSTECLVETPQWDFGWQQAYYFDVAEAPIVSPGDKLRLTCTYDNSLDNPGLRKALDEEGLDAPIDVGIGESSLDEMCIAILGAVPAP